MTKRLHTTFPLGQFAELRTPFYCYDMPLLVRTLEAVCTSAASHPGYKIHYAVKANANSRILQTIAASGLGADCVSGGEIRAALAAGFQPQDMVYAGVGKTDEEIRLGLVSGISRFNVESLEELAVIDGIAAELNVVAPVSLRVNPDVAAHTLTGITTGRAENKFGIAYDRIPEVICASQRMKNVKFMGLHFHIGSQILDMNDFTTLCGRINQIVRGLHSAGLPVGDLNVGGGLGIDYNAPDAVPVPDFDSYFAAYACSLETEPGQTVHFELGRSIVGQCGSLISRVLYVKQGSSRQFAILDGSMTELIRPALYHAVQQIQNLSSDEPCEVYDVVGPVCESSDVFGKNVALSRCHRGDLIAIRSAGAYGESMSSCYNCRPLPQSFFIE